MLYHYTDYVAFDGIVNHAELRVNNILNMNDASEMSFFIKRIQDAVYKQLVAYGMKDKANRFHKISQINEQEAFHFSAYAACFSGYRDDAAQWERYGNDGAGVCIAFDKELLKQISGATITLQDVYYQKDLDNHPLVQQFVQLLARTENFTDLFEDETWNMLRRMTAATWTQAAAFKHPSFHCENEVRLVFSPFAVKNFPVKPKYHVACNRIKKYYPLNLRDMCNNVGVSFDDLIKEVIIGPTSTQSLPILQDYLRDVGLKKVAEKISKSECPLR